MLDEQPVHDEDYVNKAHVLRLQKRYAEALEMFLAVVAAPAASLTEKQLRHTYSHALTCMVKLKDWPRAEAFAHQALARFPGNADAYCRLGEALMRMERYEEAEPALARAIELAPGNTEAPLLLELARGGPRKTQRVKVMPWPSRPSLFENLRSLIKKYLLRYAHGAPIIEPDSVFMTLGSCFAMNLASHLRETGRKVNAEEIGEDVNSTYANRYLLDWVENGATNTATAAIQESFGPKMRERIRKKISESDIFVITLGVAACFFRKDDGEFAFIVSKTPTAGEHLFANHVMRTTDVDENIANIRYIMDAVARLAERTPKFVLTVSPVPMGGTTERDSAVLADCISKSTLRLAADKVCQDPGGHQVVYWPSFEIVRWLGPHMGPGHPQVFGGDDGNTRHVSNWLVKLIIEMFVEHHSAAAEGA